MNYESWVKRRFIGIDFSGSVSAGRSIWISEGVRDNRGLRILDCRAAADLEDSGRDRDIALKALKQFICRQENAVVGLDFPFSLPAQLLAEESWADFIRSFPALYDSPDLFRKSCFEAGGGRELKRITDHDSRAPFSPYNLRLYRQTYYGIRELLSPLVANKAVSVLPMQEGAAGRPWLIEICPASYLKRERLSMSYKGRTDEKYRARLSIINFLESERGLQFEVKSLREKVLSNFGGDALDSIIAALCALRAGRLLPAAEEAGPEGFIFY